MIGRFATFLDAKDKTITATNDEVVAMQKYGLIVRQSNNLTLIPWQRVIAVTAHDADTLITI